MPSYYFLDLLHQAIIQVFNLSGKCRDHKETRDTKKIRLVARAKPTKGKNPTILLL